MSKKARFVIFSLLEGLAIVALRWGGRELFWLPAALVLATGVAFWLVFWSTTKKQDLIFSLVLPIGWLVAFLLFDFLWPTGWLWDLAAGLVVGGGLYTSLLVVNVLLVSAEYKRVPLYRAALAVGFVLVLVEIFLFYHTIFSFRAGVMINSLASGLVSLVYFLFLIWMVTLGEFWQRRSLIFAVILGLILAQFGLVLSFWPAGVTKSALYLLLAFYLLAGLTQAYLRGRLFTRVLQEYLAIGLGIFLGLLLTTSWRGM